MRLLRVFRVLSNCPPERWPIYIFISRVKSYLISQIPYNIEYCLYKKSLKLFLEKAHIFTDHMSLEQIENSLEMLGLWLCFSARVRAHWSQHQVGAHQGSWIIIMSNWRAVYLLPSIRTSAYHINIEPLKVIAGRLYISCYKSCYNF